MPESLPPEVLQEIKNTADVIKARFTPPEFIPGCQVVDVTDIDLYATSNGWIEAICGQHNQQRVRYKGFPSNVGTASYVDVLYFQNRRLFECYGSGGTIAPPGADGWPFDALKVISPTNASAEATTVQGAFDTGDALDIFLVDPGLYTENVTANKLISIVGGEAARCVLRGTTSDTPVINATAAALFKELTVTNEAGGTTATCVNVSTSLVSPQFYNLRVSKSLGGGTTGVGFDISAGTGIWIENCRINISNGTNRYGIRVTGTATFTVTVVGGSISATTADVLVNNSNATVRLWGPVLTGGGLSVSAGTVTGWWYDSSGGLHIIGGGWPYNDVHNVGGNARLATVETALNDAAVGAGDVVELGQDSTEDAVALDKTVTVQGKSREFALTVDNSANGLNISANGARAERLNVINTTTAATTYGVYCNATGIVLERVSALVAAGGTTRYGIAVPSSMDATLRDCTGEGTGGGGTNIGLVVDGTATVYGGEFSGDDYSLAIGAAGTVSLYGPRLNGAIYNSGTITDDSWWYDASGDVHLAASTNGLNTRFENLFGDDVPAATYKFTQRTFLVDSGADQLGFETSQANPYSLAGTNFTLSAPASNYNFRSNFSTHWLLFTCTDATTPLYLTWSGTAKNYYRGLVWFGSPPAVSDQYLFELRLWDTTTPGAGSAYYGWRIDWLGSTYPQYPLRFQGVRGTGVTFPDGGRTNLGASAPLPVHPFFFVTRLLATNAFYVSLAEAESPYPFYELNNSTGSISQFQSARFHAPAFSGANGYGLCMFDQIQVT